MYQASELFKKAISQHKRELRIRCTIDGQEYSGTDIQQCSVEESILTDDNFKFGSATASPFELTILNMDNNLEAKRFEGKEVHIEIGAYLDKFSRPIEYVSVGYFVVEKATKDNNLIRMTGYDGMIYFEKPYIPTVSFPATLVQILQDVCNQAGVELETTSFINNDYVVSYTPDFTDVTCRQVVASISELACGYATINRNKKLEIRSFVDTDITINKSNYYSMNLSEYEYGPIGRVVINNDGIIEDAGTGEHILEIKDNLFALNPSGALLQKFYNAIQGFTFKPFTTTWQGNVLTAPGDLVNVKFKDGATYKSFIAKQKFVFGTGLKCEIETNTKTQMQVDYQTRGSVTNQLKRTKSEIKNLGDSISLEVQRLDGEIATQSARITLTDENITSEVSRIDGELSEQSSRITQTADDILLTVKKGDIISSINQTAETIQISASKLDLLGAVGFYDLDFSTQSKIGEGESAKSIVDNWAYDHTYIDGSKIFTGSIKAQQIDTGGLKAERLYNPANSNHYAVIGGSGTVFDLTLTKNSDNVFQVLDTNEGIRLYTYDNLFLGANGAQNKVVPYGTWDFSQATVSGINTVAVFG